MEQLGLEVAEATPWGEEQLIAIAKGEEQRPSVLRLYTAWARAKSMEENGV